MWTTLVGLAAGLYLLWKAFEWYMKGDETYWPKLGVPFVPQGGPEQGPTPWKAVMTGQPFHVIDDYYYNKFPNERFVGTIEFRRPMLMIKDPELVKMIMVKDFDHFVNRTPVPFGGDLSDHFLLNMQDQKWKNVRSAMTPTFTSGKIRRMFEHFEKSAKDLVTYVERKNKEAGGSSTSAGIHAQDVFGRFAMDVIGSTAFGFDSQSLTTESSIFYKMGLNFTEMSIFRGLKLVTLILLPKLATWAGICFFPNDVVNFFRNLCLRVLNARRENLEKSQKKGANQSQTTDFIDQMIETQKRWQEDEDSIMNEENEEDDFDRDAKLQVKKDKNDRVLTDNVVIANSLGFFIAGFDNTTAVLTLAAYHLAVSPEIQDRLRSEVEEVIADHDDRITYEAVVKMTYLDMFVNEVLRLYPPTTRMERLVTKAYKIPGTEIVLPAGISTLFPIIPFHQDPKYFPEPKKFNPENFSAEKKAKRHPYVYMTFGHGPRSCIGMRFVVTEIKAAVAHLVHQFELRPSADTKIPITVREAQGMYRPEPNVKLAFIKRDTN